MKMKTAVWLLVVVLAGMAVTPASATTSTIGRSDMLLFIGDGISVVANAATIATGNHNAVLGWVGVGLGVCSMAVGFTTDDGNWLAGCGGVAAAFGIASLSIGLGSKDEELGTHQLKVVPGLARSTDGEIETRLTLKLDF